MGKAMTIDSSLSRIRYIGNGVTTTFSIPFAYLTNNDGSAQLAVYVGDSDTPLVEGEDYTIVGLGQAVAIDDDVEFATYEERFDGGDVVFGVAPEQGVPVAVVRNVPQTQGVVFVEGEKFPAQDFENALDKLTMEVQEVKENLQRAIVLPPTSTEKPIEARDAILLARDEAKTAAEQAQTAADNATSAVEEAEQQLADTKVYVDSAKADIDNTVVLAKADIESTKDSTIAVVTSTSASAVATIEQTVAGGKQEINTTIEDAQTSLSDTTAQAVEDVKAEVTKAAENAIQNAADEATQIATEQTIEYVENTAIPAISAVKDSAVSELESVLASDKSTLEGYVQVASDSVAISTQRASEAAESARVAGEKVNQIDGVVDDVNAAAASASASKSNAKTWAEGTDSEVQALGGVHSSKGWSENAMAVVDGKQDIANLSQTLDTSTTKYPSNKAVVDYSAKRHQVVSVLPVNPDPDTFYYITEEQFMARVWLPRILGKNGNLTTFQGELTGVFDNIKTVDKNVLYYAFSGCTGITGSISFPTLTTVGERGLYYAFSGCTDITNVSFPALTTVGEYGLYYAFNNCAGITSVSFPSLTTVDKNGLYYAFNNCAGITSVSFPALTTVGYYGLQYTFKNCTGITGSISFPALTTVDASGLRYAFSGCTGITELHFRADAKSVIEAATGYSTNFGASNATIYFDL